MTAAVGREEWAPGHAAAAPDARRARHASRRSAPPGPTPRAGRNGSRPGAQPERLLANGRVAARAGSLPLPHARDGGLAAPVLGAGLAGQPPLRTSRGTDIPRHDTVEPRGSGLPTRAGLGLAAPALGVAPRQWGRLLRGPGWAAAASPHRHGAGHSAGRAERAPHTRGPGWQPGPGPDHGITSFKLPGRCQGAGGPLEPASARQSARPRPGSDASVSQRGRDSAGFGSQLHRHGPCRAAEPRSRLAARPMGLATDPVIGRTTGRQGSDHSALRGGPGCPRDPD